LYGIPISPSAVFRLAVVAGALGEGSVGLFVDHPTHVKVLDDEPSQWPGQIPVWVNIGLYNEQHAKNDPQIRS